MNDPNCRHCGYTTTNSRRGLCHRCYNQPHIRNMYPGRKPADDSPKCRHCKIARANRARRLCSRCYFTPGVREKYNRAPGNERGLGIGIGASLPPTLPLTAPLGTEARIKQLRDRVEAGQSTAAVKGDVVGWGAA